jgi:hypothetical protein
MSRFRFIAPLLAGLLAASAAGCASARRALDAVWPAPAEPVAATPAEAPPATGDSATWYEAVSGNGERIVVSRERRRLWLMRGDSAVLTAPVAIGRDTVFEYRGRSYDFSTPTGRRTVLGKEESPDWIPPDWHYFEKAVERGLEPVHLKEGDRIELSDGTLIEVRKAVVGRINRFGNWWPFTAGSEIVFDGRIFIPPVSSPQRRIPKVLGTHRLILGDGYLIHGTPEEDSIGQEASHGCIRMFNRDIALLHRLVEAGTPVFVY